MLLKIMSCFRDPGLRPLTPYGNYFPWHWVDLDLATMKSLSVYPVPLPRAGVCFLLFVHAAEGPWQRRVFRKMTDSCPKPHRVNLGRSDLPHPYPPNKERRKDR